MDGAEIDTKADMVLVDGASGRYVRWWDMTFTIAAVGDPMGPASFPEPYLLWQGPGQERDHPGVIFRSIITGASELHRR